MKPLCGHQKRKTMPRLAFSDDEMISSPSILFYTFFLLTGSWISKGPNCGEDWSNICAFVTTLWYHCRSGDYGFGIILSGTHVQKCSYGIIMRLVFIFFIFLIKINQDRRNSLEIFRSLSEILFTHTGSDVYSTSCCIACRASSLLELGCRFLMSWLKILFSFFIIWP